MTSKQEEKPSAWGEYSENYKKTVRVPYHFSEIAIGLLFPPEDPCVDICFLDVAAGPGVLVMSLADSFKKSGRMFSGDSSFIISDFAPGMVAASEKTLSMIEPASLGVSDAKAIVVDACDPHNIVDQSVTHMGCVFGVMFFPQRAQAFERLHAKLHPEHGKAVFVSWNVSETVDIAIDFGCYLLQDPSFDRNSIVSPVSICQDPVVFQSEMEAAGFHNVKLSQASNSFQFVFDQTMFNVLVSNPAIVSMFPTLSLDTAPRDELFAKWQAFLATEAMRARWVRVNEAGEDVIELYFRANFALAQV